MKKNGVSKISAEMRSGTTMKGRLTLRECLDFVREGDEFVFTGIEPICRSISLLTTYSYKKRLNNVE